MIGYHSLYNDFNNVHMQTLCKTTPDAFKHVPDLFWRALQKEIRD